MPGRLFLATYIIRIYRLKPNEPHNLVGIVEEVGGKGKKAFTHYDELWDILNFREKSSSSEEAAPGKRVQPKQRETLRKEEK